MGALTVDAGTGLGLMLLGVLVLVLGIAAAIWIVYYLRTIFIDARFYFRLALRRMHLRRPGPIGS